MAVGWNYLPLPHFWARWRPEVDSVTNDCVGLKDGMRPHDAHSTALGPAWGAPGAPAQPRVTVRAPDAGGPRSPSSLVVDSDPSVTSGVNKLVGFPEFWEQALQMNQTQGGLWDLRLSPAGPGHRPRKRRVVCELGGPSPGDVRAELTSQTPCSPETCSLVGEGPARRLELGRGTLRAPRRMSFLLCRASKRSQMGARGIQLGVY